MSISSHRTALLAFAFALSTCPGVTHAAPLQPGTATISGIVFEGSGTSKPLRKASVLLYTAEASFSDWKQALAWTDSNGRFSFSFLPAGRYALYVQKEGFKQAAYGGTSEASTIIELKAGENRNDFLFHMHRLGTISGVVLDETGAPVANASVQVFRYEHYRQQLLLRSTGFATADDSGAYKLDGLIPGRYVVSVEAWRLVARVFSIVDAADQAQRTFQPGGETAVVRQYYPGADRPSAATPVRVKADTEVGNVNFRLGNPIAQGLSGHVQFPGDVAPGTNVSLQFFDAAGTQRGGTGAAAPGFNFEMKGLSPDEYTIAAQASGPNGEQYRVAQKVAPGESSVTVALQAGIALEGTVRVVGPGAEKHAPKFVTLSAGEYFWQGSRMQASVDGDGKFRLFPVLPGSWDISAGPFAAGMCYESMYLGDYDVLVNDMVITPSTSAPLNIVLSTACGTLKGSVTDGQQHASKAAVLLVPEGERRNIVSLHSSTVTDESGHYEFKGVIPGQYRIYAIREMSMSDPYDPEFLRVLEPLGTKVEAKANATTDQDLELTAVPEKAE